MSAPERDESESGSLIAAMAQAMRDFGPSGTFEHRAHAAALVMLGRLKTSVDAKTVLMDDCALSGAETRETWHGMLKAFARANGMEDKP